jgi:hypothetical protein
MFSTGLSPLYCAREAPSLPTSLLPKSTLEEQAAPAMPAMSLSFSSVKLE